MAERSITVQFAGDTRGLEEAFKKLDHAVNNSVMNLDAALAKASSVAATLHAVSKKSTEEVTKSFSDTFQSINDEEGDTSITKFVENVSASFVGLQRSVEDSLSSMLEKWDSFKKLFSLSSPISSTEIFESSGENFQKANLKFLQTNYPEALKGASTIGIQERNASDTNINDTVSPSISKIQKFDAQSKLTGVSTNQLATFEKNLQDALTGTGDKAIEVRQNLHNMNIAMKDAEGNVKSLSDLTEEVVDKFASYQDGALKNRLVTDLFGKSTDTLISLLNKGGETYNDYAKASGSFSTYSKEAIQYAEDAHREIAVKAAATQLAATKAYQIELEYAAKSKAIHLNPNIGEVEGALDQLSLLWDKFWDKRKANAEVADKIKKTEEDLGPNVPTSTEREVWEKGTGYSKIWESIKETISSATSSLGSHIKDASSKIPSATLLVLKYANSWAQVVRAYRAYQSRDATNLGAAITKQFNQSGLPPNPPKAPPTYEGDFIGPPAPIPEKTIAPEDIAAQSIKFKREMDEEREDHKSQEAELKEHQLQINNILSSGGKGIEGLDVNKAFKVGMDNYKKLPDDIKKAIDHWADFYKVSKDIILAIGIIESRMKQLNGDGSIITSKAGARGMFQFMPGTEKMLGGDAAKVESQVKMVAQYLAKLRDDKNYKGNLSAQLDAYSGHTPRYATSVAQLTSMMGAGSGSYDDNVQISKRIKLIQELEIHQKRLLDIAKEIKNQRTLQDTVKSSPEEFKKVQLEIDRLKTEEIKAKKEVGQLGREIAEFDYADRVKKIEIESEKKMSKLRQEQAQQQLTQYGLKTPPEKFTLGQQKARSELEYADALKKEEEIQKRVDKYGGNAPSEILSQKEAAHTRTISLKEQETATLRSLNKDQVQKEIDGIRMAEAAEGNSAAVKLVFAKQILEIMKKSAAEGSNEIISQQIRVVAATKAALEEIRSTYKIHQIEMVASRKESEIALQKGQVEQQFARGGLGIGGLGLFGEEQKDILDQQLEKKDYEVKMQELLSSKSLIQGTPEGTPTAIAQLDKQIASLSERYQQDMQKANFKIANDFSNSFHQVTQPMFATLESMAMNAVTGAQKWKSLEMQLSSNILKAAMDVPFKYIQTQIGNFMGTLMQSILPKMFSQTFSDLGTKAASALVGGGVQAATGAATQGTAAVALSTSAAALGTSAAALGTSAAALGVAAGNLDMAAMFSSVPSFDTGSWSLPGDMLAQVHAGEMIVPAAAAGGVRSLISGSAPS